jgi:hypothetical protein
MDPEDLREVISAYHRCVAHEVDALGGFVAMSLCFSFMAPYLFNPPFRGFSAFCSLVSIKKGTYT